MGNQYHSRYVFAVDIGNTRTSIALIDCSLSSCLIKDSVPTSDITNCISSIFSGFTSTINNSCDIKICSVVNGITSELEDLLEICPEAGNISTVNYNGNLPFHIDYFPAENLGDDRIADALYAAHFYPNKDVIIIDAGTAVTVDLLTKDKIFRGGVIFPGLNLQLKSLTENTSRLPNQKTKEFSKPKIPNSTFNAINTGTIFSVVGGIEKSIKLITKEFKNPTILCSGGDWNTIKNHIDFNTTFIEDLTLIGISLFEQ